MSLEVNLEKLERFAAKIWRMHNKEDPLSQLSFNEYDYLKVIQLSPEPIRMTDLAAELEVTKPSVSTMTKRLERKGLVARIPCPEDGRAQRLVLTEQAQHHLGTEAVVYGAMAKQLGEKLSEEETAFLNVLLNKALK